MPRDGTKKGSDGTKRSGAPAADAVTEIPLLLPVAELAALQGAAEAEGVTVGRLIRRILRQARSAGLRRATPTNPLRGLTVGVCPADCHWATETFRPAPPPGLNSGVRAFLEEARDALGGAADEVAVCGAAVRLAVPLLGRFCEIELPAPEAERAAVWQSPGWDPARPPLAERVLPLAHPGSPAGAIIFSGPSALDEVTCCRASRLFAETVSCALERVAATELARRDFSSAALVHELGNALAPLAYGAATISLVGLESPVGREVYGRMSRQITHLQSVLEGMLDLHRADHGKLVLRTRRVDLGEIVGHAADSVEPLVREKHHTLTVLVAPEARTLTADPLRLEQVLVNLLTNAAQYTAPGGRLSVQAVRGGDNVIIQVRDTGEGIPADLLPRVFDGFVQGQLGAGGLGIGLGLVRRLVEAHGGRVTATSDGPGTGCEFVVTLPVCPPLERPGSAPDWGGGEHSTLAAHSTGRDSFRPPVDRSGAG